MDPTAAYLVIAFMAITNALALRALWLHIVLSRRLEDSLVALMREHGKHLASVPCQDLEEDPTDD